MKRKIVVVLVAAGLFIAVSAFLGAAGKAVSAPPTAAVDDPQPPGTQGTAGTQGTTGTPGSPGAPGLMGPGNRCINAPGFGGWCCNRDPVPFDWNQGNLGARHSRIMKPRLDMRSVRRGNPRSERQDRPHMGKRACLASENVLRHAEVLKLTDDQVARLENLAYDAKVKIIDLHAAREKEQLELSKLFRSGSEDMGAIRSHLDAMAKNHVDMQELKISNWFETKKILTNKQKEKIKEALPWMGRMCR
jgi:Spy/CpxP family protein refolding chaperone